MTTRRTALALLALLPLAACGSSDDGPEPGRGRFNPPLYPNETPELRALINKYAVIHDMPPELIHRVCIRESTHNPRARNGPYYGLMQVLPQTARTMGFRGAPADLLDAETNLKYAGKYLKGAWIVSGGNIDSAIGWYARGYYYEAKRLGLLEETGLRG